MKTIIKSPITQPGRITSPYGERKNPFGNGTQFHDGIDYVSAVNRNVYAIADGTVTYDMDWYDHSKAWTDKRHSGGNMVILKHDIDGEIYFVRYLHLVKNFVSQGQVIKAGDHIGEYADVGMSKGAHLHLDMFNGKWIKIDPTPVMKRAL